MSGSHTLTVVATDDAGARTTSALVPIRVVDDEEGPGDGGYDAASAYAAGCVVRYRGHIYLAKWYANPRLSPANVDGRQPLGYGLGAYRAA